MKVFMVDVAKCSGCYNCQIACKDEHSGNDWAPYAAPQPNSGQFWCAVKQREHGQVPKVRVEYWPVFGGQDPAIADYAPEVLMEREDGLQVIMPEKAKGRRDIAERFEGVYYNEKLDVPQACTGCAHLVDEGKLPHCVDLCATGALRFGDAEEFASEMEAAETLTPPSKGAPRVFYLNRPHLFIAGDVWDPKDNEIIEGAKVMLTMPNGETVETLTDDFGDFYFRGIDEGTYGLAIEARGFVPVERAAIDVTESVNLGDFPLERA